MAKKPSSKKSPAKPVVKKKSAKPQRGLGRGLSALMADVNMDAIVSDDVVSGPDLNDPTDSIIMDDIMESPDPKEDSKGREKKIVAAPKDVEAMTADEYRAYSLENPGTNQAEIDASFEIWSTKLESEGRKTVSPTLQSTKGGVTYVEIGQLERNPDQPRKYFNDTLIRELADSIRQKGILQPILVREIPGKN